MAQLTLTIDTMVDIPNQPYTAQLTRVTNSMGQDITAEFRSFCNTQQLSLDSQPDIEHAASKFAEAYKNDSAVLP